MNKTTFLEIITLINLGTRNISDRVASIDNRANFLSNLNGDAKIIKQAFDTRKIDQEIDYIPRRGLQNYHRSEKFVSDSLADKLKSLDKIRLVLGNIQSQFERQPEWQDSYCRILLGSLNRSLRINEKDGDYSDTQPGVGNVDYLEQLLYTRYRLSMDDVNNKSNDELSKIFLQKDESLVRGDIVKTNNSNLITTHDVSAFNYEQLLEKVMGTVTQAVVNMKQAAPPDDLTTKLFNIKATEDHPEVERTVTITIKDKLVKEKSLTILSKEDEPEIVKV